MNKLFFITLLLLSPSTVLANTCSDGKLTPIDVKDTNEFKDIDISKFENKFPNLCFSVKSETMESEFIDENELMGFIKNWESYNPSSSNIDEVLLSFMGEITSKYPIHIAPFNNSDEHAYFIGVNLIDSNGTKIKRTFNAYSLVKNKI